MPNISELAAAWQAGKVKEHSGTSVVFRRAGHAVSLTAAIAVETYEVVGRDGLTTRVQSHDFTFTASQIVIQGEVVAVRDRDVIECGGAVYEAMPIDKRPCFEPIDNYGVQIVVHTKKVG